MFELRPKDFNLSCSFDWVEPFCKQFTAFFNASDHSQQAITEMFWMADTYQWEVGRVMANLLMGGCVTPVSIVQDVWDSLGLHLNQKVLKSDKKRQSCGQFTNGRLRDSRLSWSGLSRLTDLDDPGSRLWWLISNGLDNRFLLIYINAMFNE